MKEFLKPHPNGKYILVESDKALHQSWIAVPPSGASEYNFMYEKSNGDRVWSKKQQGFYGDPSWQRPTHPEPLPFIDDNPQSLNDQYAEIEQVRQELKGMKYDNDKPRHSLLPKGSVSAVIDVLEFGAKKYEADNWQKVDNAKERYYNAAMRHIDKWWNGEKRDPETNIHHLAHAATSLFFLIWFDENGE